MAKSSNKNNTFKVKCSECGKEFEARSKRASICPTCKKKRMSARRSQKPVVGPIATPPVKQPSRPKIDFKELFPPDVWEEIPVDIETFLYDKRYLGASWTNRKGERTMFPFWQDVAKQIFPLPMRSPYHTIIFSGATGIGKTSVAMGVCLAYYLHIVLCLRNPHEYFDLADQKNIVFAVINIVTKTMAYKNAWGIINKMLIRSPWFMERGESTGGRRPEWVCTTKPVELIYGRNEDDLIGLDILFAFLDEVSFARNQSIERQIEIATEVFDVALERMKSRFTKFGGIYEGLMCMASSKRTDVSFLEKFTEKLIEGTDKNKILVIDRPRWEVLPPESYSGERFPVAVGDKYQPSQIIKPEEVEKFTQAGYRIIWPPIEEYNEFDRNMQKALTNIAGISVGQIGSFLRGDIVRQCVNPNLQNLAKQSVIFSGYKNNDQIWDYFDLTRCRPEDFTLPLFVHLDASLGGDGNSLVGTLVDYAVNTKDVSTGNLVPELHYRVLFKIKIRAPKGSRTSLEKNRQFIFWLVQQGFNLKGVSHDQYQSAEFHEILDKAGIPVFQQSIDAVKNGINQPYDTLKNTFYEERIEVFDDEDLIDELTHLEKYENGKVDKPMGGTDDAAQCLAGSVFLASKAKEEVLASGAVLMAKLDSTETNTGFLPFDLDKEISGHFSSYTPEAIKVDRKSTLRDQFTEFFGKEEDKKKEDSPIVNPGVFWG